MPVEVAAATKLESDGWIANIIRPLEGPPHLLVPNFLHHQYFYKNLGTALNLVQDSTEKDHGCRMLPLWHGNPLLPRIGYVQVFCHHQNYVEYQKGWEYRNLHLDARKYRILHLQH